MVEVSRTLTLTQPSHGAILSSGINPAACVAMLKTLAKKSGVEFSIAEVTGDDVMPYREELSKLGVTEMFSGDLRSFMSETVIFSF